MRILTSLFCLLALTLNTTLSAEDFGTPSKDIPELATLDHYAGSWDVTFADNKTTADTTARWILQGRFLQQINVIRPADGGDKVELMTLMTYDPEAKLYRSWSFVSNGFTTQGEATWDAAKKVMTTIARDEKSTNTLTTTANFSEPDVEKWKILVTDPSGNTVSEVSGVNRRRK